MMDIDPRNHRFYCHRAYTTVGEDGMGGDSNRAQRRPADRGTEAVPEEKP